MSSPRRPDDDASPVEIEHEIERTRRRMGLHLDALGHKLSPDRLKRQAKDAVTDKVQETGSRLVDAGRRHPAAMAAVGVGAAALALWSGRRGRAPERRRRGHPLGLALVAGVVGLALGIMAPNPESAEAWTDEAD